MNKVRLPHHINFLSVLHSCNKQGISLKYIKNGTTSTTECETGKYLISVVVSGQLPTHPPARLRLGLESRLKFDLGMVDQAVW